MTLVTRGGGLTSSVESARGGKIVSLVDAFGTEWLAQADPHAVAASDASFVDAEMAGWDECAPTIVACVVDGRAVPDHGDLWNVPFEVEGDTVKAVGTSLGYRFERTIAATEEGLLLSYEAETLGDSIPFLWAAHPQFAAPPGTHVQLPAEAKLVIDVQDVRLPQSAWMPALGAIDTVAPGGTRKLYVDSRTPVHSARLVRGDGTWLAIEWSAECPYLGVWFDHAAYSREPVIAIEPSTGYFDSLATAMSGGTAVMLEPGRPVNWWVLLTGTQTKPSRPPR